MEKEKIIFEDNEDIKKENKDNMNCLDSLESQGLGEATPTKRIKLSLEEMKALLEVRLILNETILSIIENNK